VRKKKGGRNEKRKDKRKKKASPLFSQFTFFALPLSRFEAMMWRRARETIKYT